MKWINVLRAAQRALYWHSAQRARRLIAVLERFDFEPDERLTSEDLAGLLSLRDCRSSK